MTTAAVLPASAPPRPAWRSLIWIVPVTLLWTWLTYRLPALLESGLPAMAARVMVHGLIALGLWLGLESTTDLTPGQRRMTWLVIMVPFTLWMAVAWSAAFNGAFRAGASPLPLLLSAVFLPVIIGAPLLLLSRRVGRVLDAMPPTWLVALQFYRVLGSQWLVYWLLGALPGIWALPAGAGDVLTGLFAVPAVAITLGLITSPGPFQLIVPNLPGIGTGAYPNVLTPAFVVPSSILLHVLSLRQLHRRSQTEEHLVISGHSRRTASLRSLMGPGIHLL